MFKLFYLVTFSFLFFNNFAIGQSYQDSLNQVLGELADKKIYPGFAVAIIRDGEVKYSKGFGYSDTQELLPYTDASIQNIGSVSKTFIGVALMKAVELELLKLDDPINQYLPYQISNPNFPNQQITIRHLASHTGSLNDPDDYERAYIFKEKINTGSTKLPKGYAKMIKRYNGNSRVGLDDFIQSVYVPGGKYYKRKNFLKKAPGSKYVYSNIGAGIAARIIELATGVSFQEFTKTYIFAPLKMNNTTWDLTPEVAQQKVTPYLTYSLSIPQYDLITFADGGLITSVADISQYMIEMMNCYEGKGSILSQPACREMMKPFLDNASEPYGVFWSNSKSGKSIGHNGGDPGAITNVYFQPATGVAKIMFSNMLPFDDASSEVLNEVWGTMRKYELLIE